MEYFNKQLGISAYFQFGKYIGKGPENRKLDKSKNHKCYLYIYIYIYIYFIEPFRLTHFFANFSIFLKI